MHLYNFFHERQAPNKVVAYLLWFFVGGIGMLLTLGVLGIWTLIDVFFINSRIRTLQEQAEQETIQKMGWLR